MLKRYEHEGEGLSSDCPGFCAEPWGEWIKFDDEIELIDKNCESFIESNGLDESKAIQIRLFCECLKKEMGWEPDETPGS